MSFSNGFDVYNKDGLDYSGTYIREYDYWIKQ